MKYYYFSQYYRIRMNPLDHLLDCFQPSNSRWDVSIISRPWEKQSSIEAGFSWQKIWISYQWIKHYDGLNPNITNIFLITTPSNKVGNVEAICEMEPINIVFLNSKYSGLLYIHYTSELVALYNNVLDTFVTSSCLLPLVTVKAGLHFYLYLGKISHCHCH